MNGAIRYNGVGYWLALSRHTITYYARQRRWRALSRAALATLVRGYYGELCQECGRRYILWHSPNDIWATVLPESNGAGLLCPNCFDQLAEQCGLSLEWTPTIFPPGCLR